MGVGLNKTVKVCSNDYAEPPEGIPVWCVEQELSLEAGIQLGLEAILLIDVFSSVEHCLVHFVAGELPIP